MDWFIYAVGPIDNGWELLLGVDHHEDDVFKKIISVGHPQWEGDFRLHEGPHRFFLPDPAGAGFVTAYVWKQDNNGTTFIASPFPLKWLSDDFDEPIKITI